MKSVLDCQFDQLNCQKWQEEEKTKSADLTQVIINKEVKTITGIWDGIGISFAYNSHEDTKKKTEDRMQKSEPKKRRGKPRPTL